MTKHSSTLSLLIMGSILILGFQNCGNSNFSNEDLVQDQPLSSINSEHVSIDNTKFSGGLSFDYMSKTATQTLSEFKVEKTSNGVYSAQEGNTLITCTLENPNAMEELMQLTEVVTVTHPTFLASPEICSPVDGKFYHFKIGKVSPIYLIAKSQADDCLLDDPQRLLDENKRAFVINNLSFEEIESLVFESRALASSTSCLSTEILVD